MIKKWHVKIFTWICGYVPLTSLDVKILYIPWQERSFAIRSFGFTGTMEDKQSEIMKDMFEKIDCVGILVREYGKSLIQH